MRQPLPQTPMASPSGSRAGRPSSRRSTAPLLAALLLAAAVLADQAVPPEDRAEAAADQTTPLSETATRPHVCVIGGGIAGASVAHYLSNWTDVTIFESRAVLGGRVASLEIAGTVAEAGASVIAAENKQLLHYAALLGLHTQPPPSTCTPPDPCLGLWDGTAFRAYFHSSPLRTLYKLLSRYTLHYPRMRLHLHTLLRNFDKLYACADAGHATVPALLARSPGLHGLTQRAFAPTLPAALGGALFAREFVGAITRVNYGQDLSGMSALAGHVALAGSGGGLWSVRGGNRQVITGLIARSGAAVRLNTAVTAIHAHPTADAYTLTLASGPPASCAAVVIAAPLELANISVDARIAPPAAHDVGRRYQRTVTTFVRGAPRAATFGARAPPAVLTTDGAATRFTSLARVARAPGGDVYKVFSRAPLGAALGDVFEDGATVVAQFDWRAYPQFRAPEAFARFVLGDGHRVFYTAPIESAASALEMSALSGRNAAALVRRALGLGGVEEGCEGTGGGGGEGGGQGKAEL